MTSKRSSSGKRRLLGWPRLPETRPAGPHSSKAAHSRRTCRSDRPMNSPAFACVSRPSTTRRTTSRRSSSLLLIATSSVPIHPTPWRHRAAETGHLYLGGTGHFHFAATRRGRISIVLSLPTSLLHPCQRSRLQRGGLTEPRRRGSRPSPLPKPHLGCCREMLRPGAAQALLGCWREFTRQGSQVRILQRPPRNLLSVRGVGGTIFALGLGGRVHLDPIWTQLGRSRDRGAQILDVEVAVDPGRRAHVAMAQQA